MSIVISTLRREVVSLFLRAVLIRFCATISSGNCEVSNSEVERHFPPREIRFPFHVENNSRFSSWTLFQRNIDVYIKQRRSLRSTNETSCQHVQIPPKPVTRE